MRTQSVSHQAGVALVQALLITAMLLILVVQLSSDAQRNVKVAQLQAEKSRLTIKALSAIEQAKFALLAEPRATQGNSIVERWNFFGSPFLLNDEVQIALQDEGGLVSLPYGVEHLPKLLSAEQSANALQNMALWQGTNETGRKPSDYRGSLIQFEQEVSFVPGWESFGNQIAQVTPYPTWYFNPLNAPLELLETLYGEGNAAQAHQLRQQRPVLQNELAALLNTTATDLTLRPQDVVRVSVSAKSATMQITRSVRIQLALEDSQRPIRELGL